MIGIFTNKVMRGEPMSIFGDGEQTRAFSYIGDIAPVIARSVDVPEAYNQTFNVGADTPYSVNHLSEVVAAAFGVEPRRRYLPARKEVFDAYSSHKRLHAVFGHQEPVSLEEGIARMAAWARRVGPRPPSTFGAIEVRRNLPPSWAEAAGQPQPAEG